MHGADWAGALPLLSRRRVVDAIEHNPRRRPRHTLSLHVDLLGSRIRHRHDFIRLPETRPFEAQFRGVGKRRARMPRLWHSVEPRIAKLGDPPNTEGLAEP